MKYSFNVSCNCGARFDVHVTGTQIPRTAVCPGCDSSILLVSPLGNTVAQAILSRAQHELKAGDYTLAIVLGAMAVECHLAYLFMKWHRVDLILVRNPEPADEEGWEQQWREDARTVAARLDIVSDFLTGRSFDAFLASNKSLMLDLQSRVPSSASASSAKKFFVEQLFYKRNRVVHFGEIDYQQTDAETGLALAVLLYRTLDAMDLQRRLALEAQHSIQVQTPS